MRLHLKIFLTFLLIVTFLLTAIFVSMYNFQKSEAVENLLEKARIAEQLVVRLVTNQEQRLTASVKTIAEDWGLRQAIGHKETETIVSALDNHRMRAHAEAAFFIGLDGNTVSTNTVVPAALIETWKSAIENGIFSKYQIVRIGEEYFQVVLSEVKAPHVIGWLCMTHRLGELQNMIADAPMHSNMEMVVFDTANDSRPIFSSHGLRTRDIDEVTALTYSDSFSELRPTSINNRQVVTRFLSLNQAPHILVAAVAQTDDAYAELAAFWKQMAVLILVLVLLSLCVTYLVTKGITRPLHMLLSTAKKLGNGDFSTNIDVRRNDEIGDLAIAFREMQNAVYERETEVRKSMEQLEYQATHDTLTGLANRRTLSAQLDLLNQCGSTVDCGYCVCIMDLDRFKVVNDTSGHAAGDALLVQVATLLRESVYDSDTVVRLGGDEFAIILHKCDAEVARRVCENIRKQIEDLVFHWEGTAHRIGTSIGVLSITNAVYSTSEILQRADAACFVAKEGGRNQIHCVADDDAPIDKKRKELHWVQRLTTAVDKDQFILYVQPIVPLQSTPGNSPKQSEVLIRLRNFSSRKLLPPGAFIPSAERYGLHTMIDRWVITQLMRYAVLFDGLFGDNQKYWVNLSGASICAPDFVDFLESIIRKSQLPPGSINFEITETAVIRNLNEAQEAMYRMKDLGCQFSLDDFGDGLSSFGYLKSLPVDYLKIDGRFVRNILDSKVDRMFVKSIIDIAHAMDIKVIAEFVENPEIHREVTALGADFGQGFELGKPREIRSSVEPELCLLAQST